MYGYEIVKANDLTPEDALQLIKQCRAYAIRYKKNVRIEFMDKSVTEINRNGEIIVEPK